jgi:hypothetical protein
LTVHDLTQSILSSHPRHAFMPIYSMWVATLFRSMFVNAESLELVGEVFVKVILGLTVQTTHTLQCLWQHSTSRKNNQSHNRQTKNQSNLPNCQWIFLYFFTYWLNFDFYSAVPGAKITGTFLRSAANTSVRLCCVHILLLSKKMSGPEMEFKTKNHCDFQFQLNVNKCYCILPFFFRLAA